MRSIDGTSRAPRVNGDDQSFRRPAGVSLSKSGPIVQLILSPGEVTMVNAAEVLLPTFIRGRLVRAGTLARPC